MRNYLPILLIFSLAMAIGCKKESFTNSTEAKLIIGNDSLRFDTVFTTAGSVTQYFLIKNENKQKINISNVQLMGGAASAFKMNVDGSQGTQFTNIEIAGNDSMYVFVRVNVNPNADNQPFVIRDSIKLQWNGNTTFKQLEAWGQNANYIRSTILQGNINWTKDKPYVILGGMIVDTNAVLNIQQGTRIHLNADAPFIVDGTLIINGTKSDSVVFRSNRLDDPYRDYPGAWPGIYFRGSSINNQLTYTYIKNAYQGIVVEQPSSNANPKLRLNNCVLDNIYDIGLFAVNSSVVANNCLISNCGTNIALIYGGSYQFNHCTVVSASNSFVQHKNPALTATNFVKQNNTIYTSPLTAVFTNSIVWGDEGFVDNEIVVQKEGTDAANVTLNNVLFRAKVDPSNTAFSNVLRNTNPQFDSVDVVRRIYDFRLKAGSPAINKGVVTPLTTDFNGFSRVGLPDLGCYEKQ
ncbi:choice-of-anchor Q domain-containing protein [Lacibacter sediminis]|uniref:choice-of-anchor Q domain-containing protein n=1 Tax=Lacibacter sediminis TaxID=2760713 RepID=UPI00210507C6|nr:choice-of-anchor Q domain-containing protein [Lacibacter sediminis]